MMKKEYISPNIKMVEFKVEVGQMGSITGTNTDGTAATNPATDGTEKYSYRNSDGGFF